MMDTRQKEELIGLAGKTIRFHCSMAEYTTFGVGGKAEAIYEAYDMGGLKKLLAYLGGEGIPYMALGRGSNILVKDNGLEGIVILLCGSLSRIEEKKTDDMSVLAGAGLGLADLLSYCRRSGLGGLEFLSGIPGTVGGAVAMNAGAFGEEIGARVKEVHILDNQGDLVVKARSSELNFSYRKFNLEKGSVIVRARFGLNREIEGAVGKKILYYLKRKKKSQPLGQASAGSVFKNPPGDYAGRLIENAGLKGAKVGGAVISEKHANYILNTGGAKAKDILDLMYLAQEKVKKDTGIQLEPEIRIVGK
jgi:UDP-N-acetylmuramate dehydrogenase